MYLDFRTKSQKQQDSKVLLKIVGGIVSIPFALSMLVGLVETFKTPVVDSDQIEFTHKDNNPKCTAVRIEGAKAVLTFNSERQQALLHEMKELGCK